MGETICPTAFPPPVRSCLCAPRSDAANATARALCRLFRIPMPALPFRPPVVIPLHMPPLSGRSPEKAISISAWGTPRDETMADS